MKEFILKKDNVKDLCMEACGEWETYVPLEDAAGDVHFEIISGSGKKSVLERLNLDYGSMIIPPKNIGFPQLEPLFEFEDRKISEIVPSPLKKLIFGIRACDLKGILFTDNFFKKDFEDIYYLNRMKQRLFVLVGCKLPPRDCFCTSTKTGPFLKNDYDLQLVDIDDSYFVEIGSQMGWEFATRYEKYFQEASRKDIDRAKNEKQNAEKAVNRNIEHRDFEKAVKLFCEDKIPFEIYERIAERCIYCGGCNYVCPTCTCFNVFDVQKGNSGRRYRNWDACVFEGYTREASGHNPRSKKITRTSRRYEHKLKYDYLSTGMSGCVGCGRCLSSCPVNLGIIQVIEEVTRI